MFDDLPWVLTLGQAAESAGGGDAVGPATSTTAPAAGPTATEGVEGQDGSPPVAPGAAPQRQQGPFGGSGMIFIILMIAVLWFLMIAPQRKEKKKRQRMLAALSKGDRVQTVGGILGTIIEIREHDILLKVDENSNTRMRFSRSAIQSIVSSGGGGGEE